MSWQGVAVACFLLNPRDLAHPSWRLSSRTQPIQVYASSPEAARNHAAMHLCRDGAFHADLPWRNATLCEVHRLDSPLPGVDVLGECGVIELLDA